MTSFDLDPNWLQLAVSISHSIGAVVIGGQVCSKASLASCCVSLLSSASSVNPRRLIFSSIPYRAANSGAEGSDFLGPYEVLARYGRARPTKITSQRSISSSVSIAAPNCCQMIVFQKLFMLRFLWISTLLCWALVECDSVRVLWIHVFAKPGLKQSSMF